MKSIMLVVLSSLKPSQEQIQFEPHCKCFNQQRNYYGKRQAFHTMYSNQSNCSPLQSIVNYFNVMSNVQWTLSSNLWILLLFSTRFLLGNIHSEVLLAQSYMLLQDTDRTTQTEPLGPNHLDRTTWTEPFGTNHLDQTTWTKLRSILSILF